MPQEFVRFLHQGKAAWGRREARVLNLLDRAPWDGDVRPTGETVPVEGLELLAPAEPEKIVCVGLNYRDHALEMGHALPAEPLIFLKPVSSLLAPDKAIRRPAASSRVDYEAELALVVGKSLGPDSDPAGAADAIFGYTCANDVTARDLQKKDGQWTRAKGFDTFCPLGPSLWRGLDPTDLAVECRVNGAVRQSSRTSQLIFGPLEVLRFVAGVMTLRPGDLILTGTPGGIGALDAGDRVEVRIEGIGTLTNSVL